MLLEDLVVEEVYKHNSAPRANLPRIQRNNDGKVHAVTSTTRSTPTSRNATAVTSSGQLQVPTTPFLSMFGTTNVSVSRTLSTGTSTVRFTPTTTPFTLIGLQNWFVQDTLRLLAWTAMAIAAMSANMRAVFAPEAIG